MAGTSFAAPAVVGVAAALKSVGLGYGRDLTPAQLKSLIVANAAKSASLAGMSVTGGVVDLAASMAKLVEMGPVV
jgi:subtilisin family serine protease